MSTSYLYHTHSIRGYKLIRTEYPGGEVIFNIERAPNRMNCRGCGSPDVTAVYHKHRDFVTLPVGKKNRRFASSYIGSSATNVGHTARKELTL